MGLEWHNRKRSTDGRFAKREKRLHFYTGEAHTQLHIRVSSTLAEQVRNLAIARQQEIGEFCREGISTWCAMCEAADKRRQSKGKAKGKQP